MNTSNCCGCELCAEVCPVQAINLIRDTEGFLYPSMDDKKCIKCGLCERVCQYNKHKECNESGQSQAYCAKNKDKYVQMKSSSGGVFPELAKCILNHGGVVYGAAYDKKDDFKVHHRRVCNEHELDMLIGSKYVQSTLEAVFSQLATDLHCNKPVLFSGTPCQVDAIKTFLKYTKTDDRNLYTCDFICHGVPSPKVWKDYVQEIQRTYGRLNEYSFRYKSDTCKWGEINVSIVAGEADKITRYTNTRFIRSFINLYFGNHITRMSCTNCPYPSVHRVSDISLADCWGIEKVEPNMYDSKGVSLVLVNNEKGKTLFESIIEGFSYKSVDIKLLEQPHLYSSCVPLKDRGTFWKRYLQNGYRSAARRYTDYGLIRYVRKSILTFYGFLAKTIKKRIH